jgi:hypothetical protein
MASRPGFCSVLVAATLLGVGAAATPRLAAAQQGPAGAASLVMLVGDERSAPDGRSATSGSERADYGAGAIVDLFHDLGVLRVGGSLGFAAVSSADGVRSRVYMPLAAGASLFWRGESVGFDVRARLGAWAGATDAGLDADFFAACGAWLTFPLGGRASLGVGLDVWFQRAELRPGERGIESYVSPGLALVWSAANDDATAPAPPDEAPAVDEASSLDEASGPDEPASTPPAPAQPASDAPAPQAPDAPAPPAPDAPGSTPAGAPTVTTPGA